MNSEPNSYYSIIDTIDDCSSIHALKLCFEVSALRLYCPTLPNCDAFLAIMIVHSTYVVDSNFVYQLDF